MNILHDNEEHCRHIENPLELYRGIENPLEPLETVAVTEVLLKAAVVAEVELHRLVLRSTRQYSCTMQFYSTRGPQFFDRPGGSRCPAEA